MTDRARTVPGVTGAYDAAADAWADGPERVLYAPLARALVERVQALGPDDLVGTRVLDIGSGTGAAARVATSLGASVVATDAAPQMLLRQAKVAPTTIPVVADAGHLPFVEDTFDLALAAFVLNHLSDPVAALEEAGRVVRAGGLLAASTFHPRWDHPVKQAVDDEAARLGFRPPAWYRTLKTEYARHTGNPDALIADARAAGLLGARVVERTVEISVDDPRDLVRWRLGMAHLAPFVATLSAADRDQLVTDALDHLTDTRPRLRPRILLLTARAP